MPFFRILFSLALISSTVVATSIKVGADVFVNEMHYAQKFGEKRIGLITNQSAVNKDMVSTLTLLRKSGFNVVALFAPEHGFYGDAYAYDQIQDDLFQGIPVYSLHGAHRRPSEKMMQNIDLFVYDIQDIGSRSYTYLTTLFYCMEVASEKNLPFVVLDRPNPMGGSLCDGPLLENEFRSFLGYVEIPYCHGMTIGELANFFKRESESKIDLTVVKMEGWKRGMSFEETGLKWVPTSPQIPEADTPFFYPTTGIIGHCSLTNIGVGYTLPFKLIGAPWIDADALADALNAQNLPGVVFRPFHYRPFFGKHKLENCRGVRIYIQNHKIFLPVTTQFVMLGILKSMYPKQFEEGMQKIHHSKSKSDVLMKLLGKREIYDILINEKFITWKFRELIRKDCHAFEKKRRHYLTAEYALSRAPQAKEVE